MLTIPPCPLDFSFSISGHLLHSIITYTEFVGERPICFTAVQGLNHILPPRWKLSYKFVNLTICVVIVQMVNR